MKKILFICLGYTILTGLIIPCYSNKNYEVKSPDGRIELLINPGSDDNPGIRFSVSFNNVQVLQDCPFALTFKDMPGFGRNLKVTGNENKVIDETWERVWGKSKKVRNYCNELKMEFIETGERNREFNMIFRAYNDGIAFRISALPGKILCLLSPEIIKSGPPTGTILLLHRKKNLMKNNSLT
jgi:hypothetical protein